MKIRPSGICDIFSTHSRTTVMCRAGRSVFWMELHDPRVFERQVEPFDRLVVTARRGVRPPRFGGQRREARASVVTSMRRCACSSTAGARAAASDELYVLCPVAGRCSSMARQTPRIGTRLTSSRDDGLPLPQVACNHEGRLQQHAVDRSSFQSSESRPEDESSPRRRRGTARASNAWTAVDDSDGSARPASEHVMVCAAGHAGVRASAGRSGSRRRQLRIAAPTIRHATAIGRQAPSSAQLEEISERVDPLSATMPRRQPVRPRRPRASRAQHRPRVRGPIGSTSATRSSDHRAVEETSCSAKLGSVTISW